MNNQPHTSGKSLDMQLAEFRQRRFLATPLAGMIVWGLLILTGYLLPPTLAVWAVFIGTGSIIYLDKKGSMNTAPSNLLHPAVFAATTWHDDR